MQAKDSAPKANQTMKVCEWCGEAFVIYLSEAGFRKYCGGECKWSALRSRARESFNARVPEKLCLVCGVKLERRDNEEAGNYRARKTCGGDCGKAAAKMLRPPLIVIAPKPCAVCGKMMTPKPTDSPYRFRGRKACGPECVGRASAERLRQPLSPKYCPSCGVEFHRRQNETPTDFAKRHTCSTDCGHRHAWKHRGDGASRTSSYPLVFNGAFKEMIRERDGRMCQLCGATAGRRGWPVHHIDYDKTNTSIDNLITLCPSCHGKTNSNRQHWRGLFAEMLDSKESSGLHVSTAA